MHPEIQKKLNELEEAIRLNASDTTVSFRVFINSQQREVEINERSPESLKTDGISMRNIKGNFIS